MKSLLAIALVLAGTMFPLGLRGQSVIFTPGSDAVGSRVLPVPLRNGYSGFPEFGSSRAVVFPPFFGYPSSYPFTYFYPSLWPPLDEEYEQDSRIAHGNVKAEVAQQQKEYLSSQINALSNEVRALRQQQASRQSEQESVAPPENEGSRQPPPQVRHPAPHEFPATIFVFRDGHEMAVRDYAILGKTLWVFRDQTSRKFPLGDFNISASRQVNEEHGVEFPVAHLHHQ